MMASFRHRVWCYVQRKPWLVDKLHSPVCWDLILLPVWSYRGQKKGPKGPKLHIPDLGGMFKSTDSLEKTLMLGKIEGWWRRGWQRMRWLDGITGLMDMFEQALKVGDGQGSLMCYSQWGRKESDMTEQLN